MLYFVRFCHFPQLALRGFERIFQLVPGFGLRAITPDLQVGDRLFGYADQLTELALCKAGFFTRVDEVCSFVYGGTSIYERSLELGSSKWCERFSFAAFSSSQASQSHRAERC